jgi:predicted deacetylase
MNKKVLISFHDVAPYHFTRILKAEQLLIQWGVKKISFFFIPDYHQLQNKQEKQILIDFKEWIQKRKEYTIEWVLHGYYHLEDKGPTMNRKSFFQAWSWKHMFLTANEAEFLNLSSKEITHRIQKGREIFKHYFHHDPEVFVSPAWLFNEQLMSCLSSHHFSITEDHSHIYLLKENKTLSVPVITWATRTFLLKLLSRIGCPILNRVWASRDLIRIAVHPFDFDFPSTINSIKRVITQALKERQTILYRELKRL